MEDSIFPIEDSIITATQGNRKTSSHAETAGTWATQAPRTSSTTGSTRQSQSSP